MYNILLTVNNMVLHTSKFIEVNLIISVFKMHTQHIRTKHKRTHGNLGRCSLGIPIALIVVMVLRKFACVWTH